MATIKHTLLPEDAQSLAANFAPYVKNNGTNFPVASLSFDAATDQQTFWKLVAQQYGSGNITVRIHWYADTASANDVIFDAALAALTGNVDTGDIETKAFATGASVTDTCLGAGQRPHFADITLSGASLDSVAADDQVFLRLNRDANNGSDTMAGAALVTAVEVSYSDT